MDAIVVRSAEDPMAAVIREGLLKGEIKRHGMENARLKAERDAYKRRLDREQAAKMAGYRRTIDADKLSKMPYIWGVTRLVLLFLAGMGFAGIGVLFVMMGRL